MVPFFCNPLNRHFFKSMKRANGNIYPTAFIAQTFISSSSSLSLFLSLSLPFSHSFSFERVKMDRSTSRTEVGYSRGIPRLYTSKALSFEIPFCRY